MFFLSFHYNNQACRVEQTENNIFVSHMYFLFEFEHVLVELLDEV